MAYSLVSGEGDGDNQLFSTIGDQLVLEEELDFESKSSVFIRVQVEDSTSASFTLSDLFQKPFEIPITNVNEAPTDISLSNTEVSEQQTIGTVVGTISVVDQDTSDTTTYAIVEGEGGDDNAQFSLDGNILKTAALFVYSTKNSYNIRMQVTDSGGLTFQRAFTIQIKALQTTTSQTTTADTQAPTNPAITLVATKTIGSTDYISSTTPTLSLSAGDATEMYITNTAQCASGGQWETYASSKTNWSIAQTNATATVYAKFRDAAGNETSCVSDSIIHDSTGPTAPGSFNDGSSALYATPSMSTPEFSWTASSDSKSGLSHYELSIGSSAGATNIKDWTNIGNVTSKTLTDLSLSRGSTYYANIRSVDFLGNQSTVVQGNGFYVYEWRQEAYVKAANNDASDSFGFSVSLDQDTLAVGATGEDSNQTTITNGSTASADNSNSGSGSVYVYKRTGTTWVQEAYIKAVNNDASDTFGLRISLDQDTLAVGAAREDSNQTTITNGPTASADNSSSDSGAVYIYRR